MEGNWVPEVSLLLHPHGLYFGVSSLQCLSLYLNYYLPVCNRGAGSIGDTQREAYINRRPAGKEGSLVSYRLSAKAA